LATLGELNILVNIKGLSTVKSGLKELNKETENTNNQFKSAAESASVFEAQFKKQDIQLKKSQQQFKSIVSDLRSVGRELTQLGSVIRNQGLVIIGAFTAAFVSTREVVPLVDADLNNLSTSFRHISESISRAAEPSLKEFTDSIKELEKWVNKVSKSNPELINSFLKFAGISVIIGTVIVGLGTMFKSLSEIIKLLKTIGILTTTGAFSVVAIRFLGWATAIGAIYLALKKVREEIDKLGNSNIFKKLLNVMMKVSPAANLMGLANPLTTIQPGGGKFGGKGASGSWDTPSGGGSHQLSKEELPNSMTNAAAQIEAVNQKAQQAIEQGLIMAQAVRTQIGTVFDSLTKGIGDAVAQSIIYGENFLESMVNVLKSLAASIISMLVEVIAKILVLRALGVVGPIPAAALFGGGQGFGEAVGSTKSGQGIGGFFKNILGFAEGGIVTKPTLGVFGEAGPEAVVPLDKMGQMGGQVTINMMEPVFLQDEASKDRFIRYFTNALKRVTNRRTGGTALAV